MGDVSQYSNENFLTRYCDWQKIFYNFFHFFPQCHDHIIIRKNRSQYLFMFNLMYFLLFDKLMCPGRPWVSEY